MATACKATKFGCQLGSLAACVQLVVSKVVVGILI